MTKLCNALKRRHIDIACANKVKWTRCKQSASVKVPSFSTTIVRWSRTASALKSAPAKNRVMILRLGKYTSTKLGTTSSGCRYPRAHLFEADYLISVVHGLKGHLGHDKAYRKGTQGSQDVATGTKKATKYWNLLKKHEFVVQEAADTYYYNLQ